MIINRISAANRSKQVANVGERSSSDIGRPNVFYRWDHATKAYRFVVELPGTKAELGNRFEVTATQLGWQSVIEGLQKAMAEAPA